MVVCPICGTPYTDDAAFCRVCNESRPTQPAIAMPVYCEKCGARLKSGALYCDYCGMCTDSGQKANELIGLE